MQSNLDGQKKKPIYTFAVIADSHMNPEEDQSTSPWESNKRANARARWVISELNKQSPEFVVHLGDFIHPVPALNSFSLAASKFNSLFEGLESPLHLVPGNHDVGDKPAAWLPAGTVTEGYVAQYREHFGKDYFSFEHEKSLFIVINSQLINSGLLFEKEQQVWLEDLLEKTLCTRKFLFTHYPPFICGVDEEGHYDNIDEPGRSWLLSLISHHNLEAVFAGHVHNYFFNRTDETCHYVLPSIAFVRHDYSELARIGPAPENGRSDVDKLGYIMVDVFPDGHVARIVRTYGNETGVDAAADIQTTQQIESPCIAKGIVAPLAIDLRQDWAEVVKMPYNGALDEFVRKDVRNDYPMLALGELGLRDLRIPLCDLKAPQKRSRMDDLISLGHRFSVFIFGLPNAAELDLFVDHCQLLSSVEIVLASLDQKNLDQLPGIRKRLAKPIYLSLLRTSAHTSGESIKFNHFINHGFLPEEGESVARLMSSVQPDSLDGIVFRVGCDLNIPDAIAQMDALVAKHKTKALAHVRLASNNPALDGDGEFGSQQRIVEACFMDIASKNTQVCLDTFIDNDRGYFPRTGLIDRRFNPKPSGQIIATLVSLLDDIGEIEVSHFEKYAEAATAYVMGNNRGLGVIIPDPSAILENLPTDLFADKISPPVALVDLIDGTVIASDFAHSSELNLSASTLSHPLAIIFARNGKVDLPLTCPHELVTQVESSSAR